MFALRYAIRFVGYVWALPHSLFGLLLLATVYRPARMAWREGALEVVIRGALIPAGIDRTGDGDIDDPEDFRTGGQTHGWIMFFADEESAASVRLGRHERTHVIQGMIFGPLFPVLYGFGALAMMAMGREAYRDNPFERWARAGEKAPVWLLQ